MSSTATVVSNVTYHLPKTVTNGYTAKADAPKIPVYNNARSLTSQSVSGANLDDFPEPPKPASFEPSEARSISVANNLDTALRNSMKVPAMSVDVESSSANVPSKSCIGPRKHLSFQQSSMPSLDAVILEKIQTIPNHIILSDTDALSGGKTSELCSLSDVEMLCRTGSQHVPRQPLGLGNAGNTCYLNSVLQCLMASGPLLAYACTRHGNPSNCKLASGQSTNCNGISAGNTNRGFCGLCGLHRLSKEHQQRSNGASMGRFGQPVCGQIVPSYFVGNVRAVCPNLRPYQQEDAHEFLLGLLSRMEDSTMVALGKLPRAVSETNAIRRIFGSVVRSEVTCHSCRKTSARDEQCFNLSVDITEGRSLQQCLFNYIRNEELCGSNCYKCENCRQLRPAVRKSTIHQGSPILIIQFNRFSRHHKIDCRVEFPASFNLRPFMTLNRGPPVIYELYATVNHEGYSCRSGHYVAFSRRHGVWYSHNDSFVSSTNADHVLRQSPYLLFYAAVNPVPQCSNPQVVNPSPKLTPKKLSPPSSIPVPLCEIPLPPSTVTQANTTPSKTQAVTSTLGKVSSTPRIVFNSSFAQTKLISLNVDKSVHASPITDPQAKSVSRTVPATSTTPVKSLGISTPTVHQLLYGKSESPGLWSERTTPNLTNATSPHEAISSDSASINGHTKSSSHSSVSFQRKRSSSSSALTVDEHESAVSFNSRTSTSSSKHARYPDIRETSASSFEWVPRSSVSNMCTPSVDWKEKGKHDKHRKHRDRSPRERRKHRHRHRRHHHRGDNDRWNDERRHFTEARKRWGSSKNHQNNHRNHRY